MGKAVFSAWTTISLNSTKEFLHCMNSSHKPYRKSRSLSRMIRLWPAESSLANTFQWVPCTLSLVWSFVRLVFGTFSIKFRRNFNELIHTCHFTLFWYITSTTFKKQLFSRTLESCWNDLAQPPQGKKNQNSKVHEMLLTTQNLHNSPSLLSLTFISLLCEYCMYSSVHSKDQIKKRIQEDNLSQVTWYIFAFHTLSLNTQHGFHLNLHL